MKEVCIDNLNQKEREEAVNEIRLLASFRHSNIVRYCDAFISDNMLCIVRTQRKGQLSNPDEKRWKEVTHHWTTLQASCSFASSWSFASSSSLRRPRERL